jgi:NAD-dependent deacetylase
VEHRSSAPVSGSPTSAADERLLDRAAERIGAARRVIVVTGAGLSADSGLPTYRGVGGLYEGAATLGGLAVEEALSGTMLAQRPELCWQAIATIERACRGAAPNPAHHVLAALERRTERMLVVTQNVDGLHARAGTGALVELHGAVHRLRCTTCDYRTEVASYEGLELPPSCPRCGALVRPDVVLFGEALRREDLARLYESLVQGFDAVLTIGTSSGFDYVAQPVWLAIRRGIPTVEINPGRTPLSDHVELQLPLRAAVALERIAARLGLAL